MTLTLYNSKFHLSSVLIAHTQLQHLLQLETPDVSKVVELRLPVLQLIGQLLHMQHPVAVVWCDVTTERVFDWKRELVEKVLAFTERVLGCEV